MDYKIFGCKTNKYFTEKWLNSEFLSGKKGTFVASCIVTDQAKSRWIKFIKDEVNNFQDKEEKLYLSGCGVIKGGDLNSEFWSKYRELLPYKDKIIILGEDPKKFGYKTVLDSFRQKSLYTRKYLIIQNGCDNYCTYCTTIQARGGHSSRSVEEILEELRYFESKNVAEVVLTGVNIGAWGCANSRNYNESKFPHLLKEILAKTTIPRIRISSLGIEYISDELLKIMENTRIYPHFHLSIQSASDKILKTMNRNYSEEILEEKLKKIRAIKRDDKIKISIGADFIVGFPGESIEDFEKSLAIIKKYQITKIHSFPFSAHNNHDIIPAAKFPGQLDNSIKKARNKKLIEVGNQVRNNFLNENIGSELNLLIEKINGENYYGWSENYIALNKNNFEILENFQLKVGSIIRGKYIGEK